MRLARRNGLYDRDLETVLPDVEGDYVPRKRALSPWELVALVSQLEPSRAAHVVFIVATGARWSESVSALPDDVRGDVVQLHGTKTAAAARVVPVTGVARSLLAWAVANCPTDAWPRLFLPWTNVRHDLERACVRATIAKVSPNDLRRTFGVWLRDAGVAPQLIGVALGHTTSRMVELVYGRFSSPAALGKLLSEHTEKKE